MSDSKNAILVVETMHEIAWGVNIGNKEKHIFAENKAFFSPNRSRE